MPSCLPRSKQILNSVMADGPQHQPLAIRERRWTNIIFFTPVAVDGKHFDVSFDRDVSAL